MSVITFKHFAPEFLFSYEKGGGDGGMAMMMMQMAEDRKAEAARQDRLEAQRKADALAETQRLADEKANNISNSQGRIANAYESALGYGKNQLSTKGIAGSDFDTVMSAFRTSLDRVRSGLPEIVSDANSYFTPSLFDTALSDVTSTRRNALSKELDAFMGDGFERSAFADTADDSILDSILGTQKTDAMSVLDRALARGTINDAGYSTGKTLLDQQAKSGRAKAEDMGLGVLDGYRQQLSNEAKNARSRLDKYTLGDNYDIDGVRNNINTLKNSLSGRMEGDILNAIGGTNFFDTDTILGKAGNSSGVMNNPIGSPTGGIGSSNVTSPLLAAFGDRQQSNTDQKKQTNGVF